MADEKGKKTEAEFAQEAHEITGQVDEFLTHLGMGGTSNEGEDVDDLESDEDLDGTDDSGDEEDGSSGAEDEPDEDTDEPEGDDPEGSDEEVDDEEPDAGDEPDEPDEDPNPEPKPKSGKNDEFKAELDALKSQNAALIQLINGNIAGLVNPQIPAVETPKPGETPKETLAAEGVKTLAEELGEINFEDFQEDPTKFTALLQKVVDHTRQATINELRTEVPAMVETSTKRTMDITSMVNKFYEDNGDLAHVKQTVAVVANQVRSEHPAYSMVEILAESAKRARKMFGLPEPAEKPNADAKGKKTVRKGKTPSNANVQKGKNTNRRPKKTGTRKGQQGQIDDMLNAFGG